MKTIRNFCLSFFLAVCTSVSAQATELEIFDTQSLDPQEASNRPLIIIFTDSASDLRLDRQIDLLQADSDELQRIEAVIATDTQPSYRSNYRSNLQPQNFTVVLIDVEGSELARFQQVVSPATILDFLK